jgi:AcrR family transcriptional regulator
MYQNSQNVSKAKSRRSVGEGGQGRSRRPAYTREEVARAALDLLDRVGLDGLTMRTLAQELGVGTMTLYGYFRDKEELLDAVVDAAAAEHNITPPSGSWQDQLRYLVGELRSALARHPAILELRLRRPLLSPGILRGTEIGYSALMQAGFSRAETARAFRILFLYTFGFVAFSAESVTDEVRHQVQAAALLLPEAEYPTLVASAKETAEVMGGDAQFEFGLDIILQGLDARRAGRGRRPTRRSRGE